jgi:hypothetical protein
MLARMERDRLVERRPNTDNECGSLISLARANGKGPISDGRRDPRTVDGSGKSGRFDSGKSGRSKKEPET